jgi:peptidoglycan biosynthesis protein MviN/MurJ (putative lipid II flippase)
VDVPLLGQPALVLGRDGLALANAIQNSTHAVVLYLLLRRALPGVGRGLGGYVLRVGLAALAMGGIVALALPSLHTFLGPGPGPVVVAAGLLGLVSYAILLLLLRVPEATILRDLLRRYLRRDG